MPRVPYKERENERKREKEREREKEKEKEKERKKERERERKREIKRAREMPRVPPPKEHDEASRTSCKLSLTLCLQIKKIKKRWSQR